MRSIWEVVRGSAKLRQVSLVAALLFAAFSAFWTTLVFRLEMPPYHYGSQAAGLFGLVGAVGAAVAPLAGRVADRRSPRFVVANALGMVCAAWIPASSRITPITSPHTRSPSTPKIGSMLGSWAWSRWRWAGVCATGLGSMALAAAVLFAATRRPGNS